MTEPSLISIITPSLNRADMIATAIESVLAQGYPQFEHLIVDGGSTDGTLDMLKRYPHLRLLSGKDKGVYDALNKGIAAAHGDIIGQLNTDDHYDISAFGRVMEIFDHAPAVDAVVGGARVFEIAADGCERTIATYEPVGPGEIVYRSMVGVPIFNAWFFRHSMIERIGVFDTGYRIVADREFMIRVALAGIVYARTEHLIYRYRQHAGSLTFNEDQTALTEVLQEHLKLIDSFCRMAGLPGKARQYMQERRTQDTLRMAAFRLHRWELNQVWVYAREGIRSDWTWPLKFLILACGWLFRSVSKRVSHG